MIRFVYYILKIPYVIKLEYKSDMKEGYSIIFNLF